MNPYAYLQYALLPPLLMLHPYPHIYAAMYARCVHIWFVHNYDQWYIMFIVLYIFAQSTNGLIHMHYVPLACQVMRFMLFYMRLYLYSVTYVYPYAFCPPSACSYVLQQPIHSYLLMPHQFNHHPYI